MKRVYLGLGANIGDARGNMRAAVQMIRESGRCEVTRVSSLYRTKPFGVADQPDFLNAVAEITTALDPTSLHALTSDIERRLGRERTIRWGPRVIDIDILLYGDEDVRLDELTVPHPGLMERAFVLTPLAEIAPDVSLPGDVTASQAAQQLGGEGVELLEDDSWSG